VVPDVVRWGGALNTDIASGFERLGLVKPGAGVSVSHDGRLKPSDWRHIG
jgi:hypothetical protein